MRFVYWLAISVIVLVSSSPMATANATNLICQQRPSDGWNDDEPMLVELNEAQSSFVIHFPPHSYRDQHLPANTQGPIPAKFSKDTITFSVGGSTNYVLNRLTGVLNNQYN